MTIKSNAAQDELESPFYLANKSFCTNIENYIINKNGTVKGKYNAWSYLVLAEFDTTNKWKITYKKSTLTSTGNLFLSSESQTLLVLVKWETQLANNSYPNFTIRRKSKFDIFRMLFNNSIKPFSLNKYVFIGKHSPIVNNLSNINPLCILNDIHFEIINISIKIEFVDVLNYS